ncbi:MAG: ABC transporter ATP-binding protein [Pirellulaceae bacterium]
MNGTAIEARNLSKQYRIGQLQQYKALRDTMTDALYFPYRAAKSLLLRNGNHRSARCDSWIWAVKDISFDVDHGEVVGIIGRNGAGKSTLLKLLSRITEPTRGSAVIRGRVGSLLEVGTGFHPELTGRENTFLNGAILGMSRAEVKSKFDEIVAFAEVERFIDTPVKHYSSGMYLRLAFAVAAHLEPEILIVDEVLAVGDARFQKKCLNKMQDVGQQGRTVLFVSHNMPAITRLCSRTILLDGGTVLKDGPSAEVVSAYLNSGFGTTASREWQDPATAPGGDIVRTRAVRLKTQDGTISDAFDIRKPIGIEMEYDVLQPNFLLLPHHHIYNEEGTHVFTTHDLDPAWREQRRPAGRWTSTAWIPGNLLPEGTFFVSSEIVTLQPTRAQFYERDVVAFQVIDSMDGNSARGDWTGKMGGVVRPYLDWTTEYKPQRVNSTTQIEV